MCKECEIKSECCSETQEDFSWESIPAYEMRVLTRVAHSRFSSFHVFCIHVNFYISQSLKMITTAC